MSSPHLLGGVLPFLSEAHAAFVRSALAQPFALDTTEHSPQAAVQALASSGLFHILVPGIASGTGAAENVSVRSLCLAREWMAYRSPLADSIFAVQGLGLTPIARTDCARREELLARGREGTAVFAFALTEPEAGSDVAAMKTVARAEGEAWRLDGEKVYISNAGIADHYVIFANAAPDQGKKGISAFLVEKDAPGFTVEAIELSVDHPLGRLRLANVPATLLGDVGKGLSLALGTLDTFRTSVGAAACGMARRALDEAITWTKGRAQFGKPLFEYQLTQARLADMWTELDAARLLVYRAAWEKDRGEKASAEIAMAKMYATEAAQRIIDSSVQLHGGFGVTRACVAEQLYREIRALRIYEGTTEIQKLILGRALDSAR